MEEFRKNCAEELKRLDINDDEEVTVKLLSSKFKKKALKVHPDKTGNTNNDEEFKILLNDFNTCMDNYSIIDKVQVVKEKSEMADFLAKNNIAKKISIVTQC